jgi:c-di-GMP-binding flagellar brake protein YcgR
MRNMATSTVTTRQERRKHRRLEIRLPLQYCPVGDTGVNVCRTVTRNISTGGLYFDTDDADIRPGMVIELELTIPPGEGYSPYQGQISGLGEVVRVDVADSPAGARRVGVATRFREGLKLSF